MEKSNPILSITSRLNRNKIISTCTFIIQSVIYKSFYTSKCLQNITIKAQSIGENMFFG